MKTAAAISVVGCLLLVGCGTPLAQPKPTPQAEAKPVTLGNSHVLNPPLQAAPVTNNTEHTQPTPGANSNTATPATQPVLGANSNTTPVTEPTPAVPSTPVLQTKPSTAPAETATWGNFPPLQSKGKNVVLTFDDGPSPDTAKLIKTLDDEQAPAIFFWNTYHIQYADNTVKTLLGNSPNIMVGDHTVDHPNMLHLGYDAQYKEIVTARNTIEITVDRPVLFYRPPYGNYNSTTDKVLSETHLTRVLWNVDSLDWKYNSNESAILNEIKRELQPGAVILMHDHPYTIKFLPDIITMIHSEGYGLTTFKTS
jgi:peptidoglycan/xylan/chitin deacetylase (PgdA/CDA1 family)